MSLIKVPSRLTFLNSIEFINNVKNTVSSADEIIFDFQSLSKIDPFSLLFISSEMQRLTRKVKSSVINYENCSYEAHMGFFKAFGVNFGKMPGEAKGSSTYVPITILDTVEILKTSRELMVNPGVLLESKAQNIADIITQNQKCNLNDVLTYCIRELFRNVIEHSSSKQFGFCAQYRPSINIVSFALIDRGIGLKESLKENPHLKLENDQDAILEALKPAVSGKVYAGQKRKPKGDWANSGYGLFMTSNICKKGGSFFIASGESGYILYENKTHFIDIPFQGTAINLAIDTSRINTLNFMLREFDNLIKDADSKPSKSSLGLYR